MVGVRSESPNEGPGALLCVLLIRKHCYFRFGLEVGVPAKTMVPATATEIGQPRTIFGTYQVYLTVSPFRLLLLKMRYI